MENNKHSYDSLEDYLVTHPNKEVRDVAMATVNINFKLDESYEQLEKDLSKIPESSQYFKWIEKNK